MTTTQLIDILNEQFKSYIEQDCQSMGFSKECNYWYNCVGDCIEMLFEWIPDRKIYRYQKTLINLCSDGKIVKYVVSEGVHIPLIDFVNKLLKLEKI